MFARPVNGKRAMCPARVTSMYPSLGSESVSLIEISQRPFTAGAAIARASPRAFWNVRYLTNFGMSRAVWRRGKKRSCEWKEPTANEQRYRVPASPIRRNNACRRLVVATAARLRWVVDLYRLFHLGGVSG